MFETCLDRGSLPRISTKKSNRQYLKCVSASVRLWPWGMSELSAESLLWGKYWFADFDSDFLPPCYKGVSYKSVRYGDECFDSMIVWHRERASQLTGEMVIQMESVQLKAAA